MLDNNKIRQIKSLPWRKAVYPLSASAYLLILAVVFVMALNFLTREINQVFSVNEEELEQGLISLDLTNYATVAGKLGIQQKKQTLDSVQQNTAITASAEAAQNPTASSSPDQVEKEQAPIPRKLKIAIFNTTGKKGLASELAEKVKALGFTVNKIGNRVGAEETTLLNIKKDIGSTAELKRLEEIVAENYAYKTIELGKDNEYDIEIIIGKNNDIIILAKNNR